MTTSTSQQKINANVNNNIADATSITNEVGTAADLTGAKAIFNFAGIATPKQTLAFVA